VNEQIIKDMVRVYEELALHYPDDVTYNNGSRLLTLTTAAINSEIFQKYGWIGYDDVKPLPDKYNT
jgi:hypothetical protein